MRFKCAGEEEYELVWYRWVSKLAVVTWLPALLWPFIQRRWLAGRAMPLSVWWLACVRLAVAATAICLVYIWYALLRSEGLHVPSAVSRVLSPWELIPTSGSRAIPFPRIIFHPKKKRCIIQYFNLTTWLGELQPLLKGFPFTVANDYTSPSCKCSPLGSLISTTTTQARLCRWTAVTVCLWVPYGCRGTNFYYL